MFEMIAESIGNELLNSHLVSKNELDQVLAEVSRGKAFDDLILKTGSVHEKDFYSSLANVLKLPFIDLTDYRIDPNMIHLISPNLAREFCVFPLFKIRENLVVVMADPTNVLAVDRIRQESNFNVDPVVGTRSEIQNLIDQHYGATQSMGELLKDLSKGEEEVLAKMIKEEAADQSVENEQPIIRLVNLILEHAVKEHASDIHIEPDTDALRVRIRIDGILHEIPAPPKRFEAAIISRAKILADLNIAETRVPQDGRFSFVVNGRKIDIRVSTIPTVCGENLVLRILDTGAVQYEMKDLGFLPHHLEKIESLIKRPYGMFLVTGPTGSGKTTTLYTALRRINTPDKNIVTIEDPVEYRLPMIRQIQVNAKVGLTFANGLRSIVRQDPNVILVGEIRDLETAEIAVQSALTGHLVFSTLHTNDAAGAAVRLIEMGIEPFLITSSVIGVLAQRLVRMICPKCKRPDQIPELVARKYNLIGVPLYKGEGCRACHQTGYRGRLGIFEILELNEAIRTLIVSRSSAAQIQRVSIEQGMQPMIQDGIEKVKKGLTTLDEVLRVAQNIE